MNELKIFSLRIPKEQEKILDDLSKKSRVPKNSIVMLALFIYIEKNL